MEIFEPGEQEDVGLAALENVLSLFRVNLVAEDNPLFRTLFGTIKYGSEGGNSDAGVLWPSWEARATTSTMFWA